MVALRRILPTSTLKNLAGKGVHRKRNRLSGADTADVRFVHGHPDLQALEVFGDQEEAGGIEAGNHRLADVHPPVDDDSFDRGFDGAVVEVLLRSSQSGRGLGDRLVA